MKVKKLIPILIIVAVIMISLSLFLFFFNKSEKVVETEWEKKYGEEIDTKDIAEYEGKLTSTLELNTFTKDEVLTAPIPEDSSLALATRYRVVYSAPYMGLNCEMVSNQENIDFAKEIYELYKENSSEIAVYEKKSNNYVYIHLKIRANDETRTYEERLIIYDVTKNDEYYNYIDVIYSVVENKLTDKKVAEILSKIKTEKAKTINACTLKGKEFVCKEEYQNNENIIYKVSNKYIETPSNEKILMNPFEFSKKDKPTTITINVSYNSLDYEKQQRNEAFADTYKDEKVTVNEKEFTKMSYSMYEMNYLEYLYPINEDITLSILITYQEDNVENVINDFTNFSFE